MLSLLFFFAGNWYLILKRGFLFLGLFFDFGAVLGNGINDASISSRKQAV